MVSLRRMWDDVAEAGLKAGKDAEVRLPGVTRKVDDALEEMKTKVRGNDHFDASDAPNVPSSPSPTGRGVDRGDGRDHLGHYANGQDNKPWLDKEKLGLQRYGEDNDVDVITDQVVVDYDGSPQNGRKYDGLVQNGEGPNTYDGIEIKSGNALEKYAQPGNTQYQFDNAVNAGTPAAGKLNGNDILVTRVIVREES
ncbi:hypothetical protein [Microbacterium sp. AK031]|uniref:hypothetical protein n=1 Tax=Microbacterium sp. AK031 TaxID=2723076 RepID=UPI002168C57F|nr:hypothetical protein [Microbacterium sp. AK031]MCS3843492.1 hypothetical protein [Microbacterium sp. AK031]